MDDEALEAIAESDAHARWVVEHHLPQPSTGQGRRRCTICDQWWPCDMVGLAALAVLRTRQIARPVQLPPSELGGES